MLHLYETLGFWRRSSDVKRLHFAEEWNEFNHLLIMESLGGDQQWWVRFVAQHSAIVYYFVLCHLWAFSPSLAYKFSELLESHAVNTYGGFLDENKDLLKDLPPSIAAIEYYSLGGSDPLFSEYQTSALANDSGVSGALLQLCNSASFRAHLYRRWPVRYANQVTICSLYMMCSVPFKQTKAIMLVQ
jgi:hypothetical protein